MIRDNVIRIYYLSGFIDHNTRRPEQIACRNIAMLAIKNMTGWSNKKISDMYPFGKKKVSSVRHGILCAINGISNNDTLYTTVKKRFDKALSIDGIIKSELKNLYFNTEEGYLIKTLKNGDGYWVIVENNIAVCIDSNSLSNINKTLPISKLGKCEECTYLSQNSPISNSWFFMEWVKWNSIDKIKSNNYA